MEQAHLLTQSDHMVRVGFQLRQVIKALGIKQVEAAEAMGVSKSNLGNWLRGEAYPMHYPIYLFCRRYGVTADWIYLGDPSGLPLRVAQRLLGKVIEGDALEVERQEAEIPERKRRIQAIQ